MQYVSEELDRRTGELVNVNLGDWLTVTELGQQRYGVGPRRVRAVLRHMGILAPEGRHGRYRLTPQAVQQGLGKRIDRPKRSKFPFDTISPEGQRLVAEGWQQATAEMAASLAQAPASKAAADALEAFQGQRSRQLSTQQEVCWLRDHHPHLSNRQIAGILGTSEQLVGRYVKLQQEQRTFLLRRATTER